MTRDELVAALEPRTYEELERFAERLAKSTAVPGTSGRGDRAQPQYQGQPGNIVAAVLAGKPLGLGAMESVNSFYIVNGRLTLWGDAPLAVVRGSGELEYITETDDEATQTATCTVKRKGQNPRTRAFSHKQAVAAGWVTDWSQWKKVPDRMRQLRARGWNLRDEFGDVLKGIRFREEEEDALVDDTPPAPTMPRSAAAVAAGASVAEVPATAARPEVQDDARKPAAVAVVDVGGHETHDEATAAVEVLEGTCATCGARIENRDRARWLHTGPNEVDHEATPAAELADGTPERKAAAVPLDAGAEEYPRVSKSHLALIRALAAKRGEAGLEELKAWLAGEACPVKSPRGNPVLVDEDIPATALNEVLAWLQRK